MLDFALIRSSVPCAAAGVFTTNQFCAAPVLQSRRVLQAFAGQVGGVAINAGCANACTGERGLKDAETMVSLAGRVASMPNALVMSTGVIGPFLPMDKIANGFRDATAGLTKDDSPVDGWEKASRAIMTTDTQPKALHRTLKAAGKAYTLSGICKGAGMIAPNMAPPHGTLLGVVATDISISPAALQTALTHATERSFNSISIDGDTSTNDTIAALANGRAPAWVQADPATYAITSPASVGYAEFSAGLTAFCQDLAHQIVQDGEGATKFVEVLVTGARTYAEAKTIANSVARSMLVKTALFGGDANWGRILAAVGYAGVPIETEKVNLFIGETEQHIAPPGQELPGGPRDTLADLQIVKAGQPFNSDEEHATALFRRPGIKLHVDLGLGQESTRVWTCDLSLEYVKINADYRS